jgi:hypothetical protein
MKKEAIALMLLLALAMMPILAIPTSAHTIGTPYPTGSSSLNAPPVDWYQPSGYSDYQTLAWNPEYLMLETLGTTVTANNETVILQGLDEFGAPVEGTVQIPAGTAPESYFEFNDSAASPPEPVLFAKLTGIYQQNGTHNDKFQIMTDPEPFMEYLGEYHYATGWSPGTYSWRGSPPSTYYGPIGTKYLVGHGPGTFCTVQNVPVEPSNPDPLVVYINWHESDGDLYPESTSHTGADGKTYANETGGSTVSSWIYIEGLDQKGNKLAVNVTIPANVEYVDVPTVSCAGQLTTFSSVCSVTGPAAASDSYYLLTNPMPSRILFYYVTLIDHMVIYANSYDLLANPDAIGGLYPGVTNLTVVLEDADGNLIHPAVGQPVDVNFATTGGTIEPSCDVWIYSNEMSAVVNLTADTNPRTVNVTADAEVPACTVGYAPALNLFAWTEIDFDGISSVGLIGPPSWPITEMYYGYDTATVDPTTYANTWLPAYTAPVPPEPPLPPSLGGPNPIGQGVYTTKLNGPIYEVSIPLYVGCNLISSPVLPIMNMDPREPVGVQYYSASEPQLDIGSGIPMSLLFGATDSQNIEMVWWYCDGSWGYYIPSTGVSEGTPVFTDGVGYWIMCDKPCTLEISGVNMQNAPFTPPGGVTGGAAYELLNQRWSLVGVTSITGIPNYEDYLESTLGGPYSVTIGPIWVWYASADVWVRDPPWGLWPGQAFWVYNSLTIPQYLAP